ncbi:hypothetical protein PHYPSEUDO_000507 [Phytophthora pseudosyringae]|uniref:Uncharacterized protein n=1 Tax=Phytophthora pseudosyringae TaxID=221518 RepID=A0A8T1V5M9_9STRA|nr:hypothetical protein PHYPSEUDO_000507 [Phytophthora pseudosyringae]
MSLRRVSAKLSWNGSDLEKQTPTPDSQTKGKFTPKNKIKGSTTPTPAGRSILKRPQGQPAFRKSNNTDYKAKYFALIDKFVIDDKATDATAHLNE